MVGQVSHCDCYLHPYRAPLRISILKDTLHDIRGTLTTLDVRYGNYNDGDRNVIAVESEDAVKGSLSPLHDFSALASLTTSFPVLFGIKTTTLDGKDYLPPTLEMLTIMDDLWIYEDLEGRFEDLNAMAILRQHLVDQTLGRQSDAATLTVPQTDSDLATIYEDDSWIQDREPGWKTATPRLKDIDIRY
jgi:hypothetical protein